MKKILLLGIVMFGLTSLAATPKWSFQTFINQGTFLCIPNGSTYSPYTATGLTNAFYWKFSAFTNVQSSVTNGNLAGATWPVATVAADVYPDANGDVQANASVTITCGITNLWSLPANMTTVAQNVYNTNFVSSYGSSTNSVTITLVPLTDGSNADQGVVGNKSFVFVIGVTNAVQQTLSTNLPSGFLQGAAKVAVSTIVVSSGGTSATCPGVTIDQLGIQQIAP